MTPALAQTHTRPLSGDELLHQDEVVTVGLKIVIRQDGTSNVGVRSSSGITALNERAMTWVRSNWRWPKGCPEGTTKWVSISFRGW